MPLSRPIGNFMEALGAFLRDDTSVLLELEVRDELEAQAAKLLDAVGSRGDDVLVPVQASWTSELALCEAVADELALMAERAIAAFQKGERPRFPLPTGLSSNERLPVEVRLVEYAETLQRALSNHVRRLVIVLKVSAEETRKLEFAGLLQRLVATTGAPDLKWVIFTPQALLVVDDYVPRLRSRAHRVDEQYSAASLVRLVQDPRSRLETLRGGPQALSWVRSHVAGHRVLGTAFVAVLVEGISYVNRLFFFTEASRALSRACLALEKQTTGGSHVQPLFDEAHELAGHNEGEIHFAVFCERLTEAMLNERGGLLVVLTPNPATPAPELDTSVDILARSASSSRVRYLVIDPRVSARFEEPPVWFTSRLKYHLDPTQIEQGMKERLEAPDCGLVERLRYLSALSAMALGNDDPALALEHGLEALQLSAQSEDLEETTYAWYGLGNVLYQCAAFEPAERAYAECVDRSLDERNDWFAAQAMAGMGHTYFMRQLFDRAVSCYATARTIWRKLRHRHGEIHALTWHAEATARLRDFPTALARFDDALALCEGMDPALADADRAIRADLLMRKAAACGEASLGDQQRQCEAEAQQLGAAAPVCDHP